MKANEIFILGNGRVALECERILKNHFNNTKITKLDKPNDSLLNTLKNALIVSANNFYIFKPPCVKNNFIINYHNSLLPAHRGVNAHVWAIFCGDEIAGITWHRVDCGIDTGEILIQKEIKICKMSACELLLAQHKMAILAFDELVKNSFKKLSYGGGWQGSFHKSSDLPNGGVLNLGFDFDTKVRFLRAFDVGVFRQIPYAKIENNGKIADILHYEIDKNTINLTLSNKETLILKEQK
ncbi:hypothetical protein CR66_02625 [Campylobacter mucosalis]|uniref:formyltransferase family protein n=1 Tax=Campylobacter mucosalis TaxID=202 RepID=UPI0004DAEFF0|nr:formyltransferase family protein [Campylobacter mucosalis]KEA46122.1 hypothetical protein CR66_02625 [Campylobacter mucosalis]QKF62572.1 formyltransferase domain-containing protein [Campylobacter mucosalis]